jgi:hypothetical protein
MMGFFPASPIREPSLPRQWSKASKMFPFVSKMMICVLGSLSHQRWNYPPKRSGFPCQRSDEWRQARWAVRERCIQPGIPEVLGQKRHAIRTEKLLLDVLQQTSILWPSSHNELKELGERLI